MRRGRGPGRHSRREAPLQAYVLLGPGEWQIAARARRRRLLRWFLPLALALIFLGLYLSPLLRVQEVQVRGARHVDPRQVEEAVGLGGRSLIALPLGEAAARVRAIPLVRDVRLGLRWPNVLVVEVEERRPWGYWVRGGYAYAVDEEGVVLGGLVPPPGAPTIIDTSGPGPLKPGDRVDARAISMAIRLLGWAPQALGVQVAALEYSQAQGMSVVTADGLRVVVGSEDSLDFKLAVWQALAQRLGEEGLAGRVLDLRSGGRPILR